MPKRGRPEQRCCPPAEVVHHQHKREREPIAHDREHQVAATDTGGDEPGGDVEQQQFAIEREPVGQGAVGHDKGPDGDRHPPREREPSVAGFADVQVKVGEGIIGLRQQQGLRPLYPAEQRGGPRLRVGLEEPGPAIGCY